MHRYVIIVLLLSTVFFAGCAPSPYFQREEPVPQNAWQYQYQPTFKFEVSDTTVLYNLYFLIRHTDVYPYSNIWLWVYSKTPGDTAFNKTRLEIPLAEPSGKWLGRGMGEIWEQRMPITGTNSMSFHKKGKYEIRFEQNMRVNPLPEVLHVGLRVEKAGGRNFDKPRK
ncbi:MAG: gliding motility lipoprotein GldH [Taibaiella sp.]|nr:gliding motility lipoprotein GldH [Taibaiella sp.]